MSLPGPDLQCAGSLALLRFSNIFLPNIGEDQKAKSYHQSEVPPAGIVPY